MKKKVNENNLEMDMTTYKKVKGTLDPKETVKITGDKSPSSIPTSSVSSMAEEAQVDATIKPQDSETIKYLSNVKDAKTGEVSKPFTINGKNYQLVRGIKPSKEIVMAVYCHDDFDVAGENIIHPMEYFEENIAKKAIAEGGADDFNSMERDLHDKENLAVDEPTPVAKPEIKPAQPQPKNDLPFENTTPKNNSLNLGEYKHFIVNKKNGKVRKFKRVEELAKAGMGDDEAYMNLSQFKKHVDEALFGKKNKIVEDELDPQLKQIKPDVSQAIEQMILKMKPYMNKLNQYDEKIQFIVKLTNMLVLEPSKYPVLMSALKKSSESTFNTAQKGPINTNENKIISKKSLEESISKPEIIKTIKVKDII